jgi:hypothetical protein
MTASLEETIRRTLNSWVDPTTRDEAAAIIASVVREWLLTPPTREELAMQYANTSRSTPKTSTLPSARF